MARPDLMAAAEQERSELLDLLLELGPEQWEAPSLCARWRVRDVAVHIVSYDELSGPALAATFARGGLRPTSVNAVALRRYDGLDTDGILDLVARCRRPRGLTAGFNGGIALTDGTIHQQDIRRALGILRTIPADRLSAALGFAMTAPTLPATKLVRGLRLVATDLDWAHGKGPEVTGSGESLLMAATGRAEALEEVAGPGAATLRSRVLR